MTSKQTIAVDLFNNGFNCSQSVLAAFAGDYGLDKETALKLSGGFGGGVRSGEVCGAVTGAVAVVGLKYGQYVDGDADSKAECNSKTGEFITKFKENNKSIVCRELLGFDISTDQERAKSNLHRNDCVNFIKSAVSTLEELGY